VLPVLRGVAAWRGSDATTFARVRLSDAGQFNSNSNPGCHAVVQKEGAQGGEEELTAADTRTNALVQRLPRCPARVLSQGSERESGARWWPSLRVGRWVCQVLVSEDCASTGHPHPSRNRHPLPTTSRYQHLHLHHHRDITNRP
jgi:hypothetical protein